MVMSGFSGNGGKKLSTMVTNGNGDSNNDADKEGEGIKKQ